MFFVVPMNVKQIPPWGNKGFIHSSLINKVLYKFDWGKLSMYLTWIHTATHSSHREFHFLWNRSFFWTLNRWTASIWLTLAQFLQPKTLRFYIVLLCVTQNTGSKTTAPLGSTTTFTICSQAY